MSDHVTSSPLPRNSRFRPWWIVVLVLLVAIGVGVAVGVLNHHSNTPSAASRSGGASKGSALLSANTKALNQLNHFAVALSSCSSASDQVSCTEQAETTFGNQLHTYANLLAGGGTFGRAEPDAAKALLLSQFNANTFEVLGNAGPTKADYDRVLHHQNLQVDLNQLENALNKINDDLRGI
jgi:hypothetical protein